ncbi:MAG TPA: hypothetical protein VN408_14810 [Actinoplanes sp.]|nr:hypothetical protein [Actinoplanes sp.]
MCLHPFTLVKHCAALARAGGWYVRVGYGETAGTRAGRSALDRQGGTPARRYRAEVTNVEE